MIGYLLSLRAIILWERGPGRKRFLPGLFMQFRFEIVSNGVRCPLYFRGEQSADWNLLQQKTAPVRTGPELFAYILKLLDRVVDSQCEDHRCQCPHGVVGDATAQQRGQQSQRGKTAGCIYRQLIRFGG